MDERCHSGQTPFPIKAMDNSRTQQIQRHRVDIESAHRCGQQKKNLGRHGRPSLFRSSGSMSARIKAASSIHKIQCDGNARLTAAVFI
jgi:hypothetical protein